MKKFILGLLAVFILLSGCASTEKEGPGQNGKAPLFGMLYSTDSTPVSGALVTLDMKQTAQTDINGRFFFNEVSIGDHTVGIKKDGFEEALIELSFLNRDMVLYASLVSLEDILDDLENTLKSGRINEAKILVERAEKIDAHSIRLRYLKVVFLSKIKKYADALLEIENLRALYPEDPYLVMTKAEILFHGLGRVEAAIDILRNSDQCGRNEELGTLLKKIASEWEDSEAGGEMNE